MIFRIRTILATSGALVFAAACGQPPTEPAAVDPTPSFSVAQAPSIDPSVGEAYLDNLNVRLAGAGAEYRVVKAEWIMEARGSHEASIVFATDRTLRLSSKWVPNDARRLADGINVTQATFQPLAVANGAGAAGPAIDASFDTWGGVACSNLPIVRRTLPAGIFPSAILSFTGFVNDPFAADIATIGFVPAFILDAVLGPGAGTSVLGVTFTFIFVSGGAPTDIDGDGRADTALKEVWYNNGFTWTTGSGPGVDIETVALHENGHALELGHFGRVAVNLSSGKLNVSPRAVMNAFVLGVLRSPLGTDNGAFCGNFASWPN